MEKLRIGFIGCGNMASAMILGMCKNIDSCLTSGIEVEIRISDNNIEQLKRVEGISDKIKLTSLDNSEVIRESDYILIALKPQVAPQILPNLVFSGKRIVSFMAGVSLATLQKLTKAEKIVRVMPNLNARVLNSYSGFCQIGLCESEKEHIKAMLCSFGECQEMDEGLINAVTAVSASGAAFVFSFIKAYYFASQELGFCDEESIKIVRQTMAGSVNNLFEMLERNTSNISALEQIDSLIDSVCSKGGTTIEGINHLQGKNFEKIVFEAIQKAFNRANELEKA